MATIRNNKCEIMIYLQDCAHRFKSRSKGNKHRPNTLLTISQKMKFMNTLEKLLSIFPCRKSFVKFHFVKKGFKFTKCIFWHLVQKSENHLLNFILWKKRFKFRKSFNDLLFVLSSLISFKNITNNTLINKLYQPTLSYYDITFCINCFLNL